MISEFPLFCFTTLAGLAAGAYAVNAFFPAGKDSKRAWLFPLACMVLLGVGLIGLPLHLGRPERMFIALTHPSAMIAQEAYWSMAFGIVLLADTILLKVKGSTPRALRIAGAIFGVVLTAVMGNAYFVSLAISAWSSFATFPFFILGDIAMGVTMVALFDYLVAKDCEDRLGKSSNFLLAEAVSALVAALAIAVEGFQFSGAGLSVVPFVVAAVVALAAAGIAFAARMGKVSDQISAWGCFAALFVAVAIARYAFYAACVL